MRAVLFFAGRWLTIAGGATVAAGSLMPWAELPILGVMIPVSGLFGLGSVTCALGLAVSVLCYRGYRLRLLYLLIAGAVLWIAAQKTMSVKIETRSMLLRMEMQLYPINQALAQLGAPPVSVTDTSKKGSDLVGVGLWLMPIGSGLILAGCLTSLFCRPLSFRSLPFEFVGFLACRHCATLVSGEMLVCPKCGRGISDKRPCPKCFQVVEGNHRFCFRCGETMHP